MNCGAVPVGTVAGGISEVIQHEKTGYLVDIGDYTGAGEHIIKILEDDALYNELQARMLEDIRSRFHSDVIVSQYESLYNQLIGEKNNA